MENREKNILEMKSDINCLESVDQFNSMKDCGLIPNPNNNKNISVINQEIITKYTTTGKFNNAHNFNFNEAKNVRKKTMSLGNQTNGSPIVKPITKEKTQAFNNNIYLINYKTDTLNRKSHEQLNTMLKYKESPNNKAIGNITSQNLLKNQIMNSAV